MYTEQHDPNKVIIPREEVAEFVDKWPGCSLQRNRAYWFEFDSDGNELDSDVPEQDDGPAALTLSADAWQWLQDNGPLLRDGVERAPAQHIQPDAATARHTQARVNFACQRILSGGNTTRKFDSCFENDDSRDVAAGVYARALKNSKMMAALPHYLDVNTCKADYERLIGAPAQHIQPDAATPGPWEVATIDGGESDDEVVVEVNGCLVNICAVFGACDYSEHRPNGEEEPHYEVSAEEAKANACLIAASRDLLEALLDAVRIAERDGMPGNPGSAPAWVSAARAAIVKATGDQS